MIESKLTVDQTAKFANAARPIYSEQGHQITAPGPTAHAPPDRRCGPWSFGGRALYISLLRSGPWAIGSPIVQAMRYRPFFLACETGLVIESWLSRWRCLRCLYNRPGRSQWRGLRNALLLLYHPRCLSLMSLLFPLRQESVGEGLRIAWGSSVSSIWYLHLSQTNDGIFAAFGP